MFKLFKRKKNKLQKGFDPIGVNSPQTQRIFFQQMADALQPSDRTFIEYYQQVEPLADAVDRIGDKVSEMQLFLLDVKKNQFLKDSWVLDLLQNPNTNVCYAEFMKASSNYLTITGNNYWIMTRSPVRNRVLEIFSVSPELITVSQGADGRPISYNYSPQGISLLFTREDFGRNIRYLSDDRRQELIHVREFNPNGYEEYLTGVSRLHAIVYAILQYKAASIHNLSLLNNGARISGMVKYDKEIKDYMTPEQLDQLNASIQNMFTGEANAGRIIANNGVDDFISFMQNNVDMDFAALKKQVEEAIYKRLKIPLMLVETDAATLNNYETALIALYDDAVIPQFNQLVKALRLAFSYYDNSLLGLDFTFDPLTIPALRSRRIDELTRTAALNVLTDNEIRNFIGFLPYKEGDEVYKPTTMAPVGVTIEDDRSVTRDRINADDSPE